MRTLMDRLTASAKAMALRRSFMRRRKRTPALASIVVVGAIAALALSLTVAGQTPARPAYRAPRTTDGKPNLSGVYQAITEAYWDIEPHSAAPGPVQELGASFATAGGLGITDGPLPYKPEALAKKKENYANRLKLDPEIKCYLPGTPRGMYIPRGVPGR